MTKRRAGTVRMLYAATFAVRRSKAPTTATRNQALELAVCAAAKALDEICLAGLRAATGRAVHSARLRLAASRALLRALEADIESGAADHMQDLVDRLDDKTPRKENE